MSLITEQPHSDMSIRREVDALKGSVNSMQNQINLLNTEVKKLKESIILADNYYG